MFNQLNIEEEYENHNNEKQLILNDLQDIIIKSNCKLEGNSFYVHETLNLYPSLHTKQLNIFWCGKQATTRICEIGFNAGHSTMLFLLGLDKKALDFTLFDIGEHNYTEPCYNYIKNRYPHINFEFIKGDSTETIPIWINNNQTYIGTYDIVHVDGGHSEKCITNDMKNADILIRKNGIIIVDDVYMFHINKCVDDYLSTGNYTELFLFPTIGYTHRLIKKNI
jgi:hypothetical protein